MGRMIKEMVVQDCPIRNVLARVCDKWSLLVIYTLKYHQEIGRASCRERV
mgnify:CR=1 FL=1